MSNTEGGVSAMSAELGERIELCAACVTPLVCNRDSHCVRIKKCEINQTDGVEKCGAFLGRLPERDIEARGMLCGYTETAMIMERERCYMLGKSEERNRWSVAANAMAREAEQKFPCDGTVSHWLRSLVAKHGA